MDTLKLNKERLSELVKNLKGKYNLYGPTRSNGLVSYDKVETEKDLLLDFSNSKLSPKGIFFPETEEMIRYNEGKVEPVLYQEKPIAIFGLRPCDAGAISFLNQVFTTKQFQEPNWVARYENSLIFTIGCNYPLPTCFCKSLGNGPFHKEGTDILLTDIGDAYLVEPCSEPGEKFVKELEFLEKPTSKELDKAKKISEKSEASMNGNLDLSKLNGNLNELWDDPIWEKLGAKCLGCAVCSFSCPTCHCFDIQDEGNQKRGRRIRLWDTCMFPLFTQEGSGHNPRPEHRERMRQRVMHKFSYIPENFGRFGCTGCGRCVNLCPVNLDIREVLSEILEKIKS